MMRAEASPGPLASGSEAGSPPTAAALSPATPPAPGPQAPVQAPAALQQPLQDPQAMMVDGVLQLQGQRLWPFDDKAQAALTSVLAAAMPGVPRDSVKVLETVQARLSSCLCM